MKIEEPSKIEIAVKVLERFGLLCEEAFDFNFLLLDNDFIEVARVE